MKWASAASPAEDLEEAIEAAATTVRAGLGDGPIDLLVAFISASHAERYAEVPELLDEALAPRVLLGCSAAGVIGGGAELENTPGVSLTAASLPGVELAARHVGQGDDQPALASQAEGAGGAEAWRELFDLGDRDPAAFIVLVDPFSCDAQSLVTVLEQTFVGSTVIGGLVSGGRAPMESALFVEGGVQRIGAVVLSLAGDLAMDTIVAQGCRPVDRPRFVTRCKGNVALELDGKPALEVMRAAYEAAAPEDRQLFERSLFIGIAMREQTTEYQLGDFLVRNVLGVDPKLGALVAAAPLEELMVVQLHVRDGQTSAEELDRLLASYHEGRAGEPGPVGGLAFSCLGRGQALYGVPNHDSRLVAKHLDHLPMGGFFCNGEIGPVQGRTFLHGYTSSFGFFRPR